MAVGIQGRMPDATILPEADRTDYSQQVTFEQTIMQAYRVAIRAAIPFALACGVPSTQAAQPDIPVMDFVRNTTYSGVKISPTGEYLAMTVDRGEIDVRHTDSRVTQTASNPIKPSTTASNPPCTRDTSQAHTSNPTGTATDGKA
jgi:hypothetical protein